MPNTIHTVSSQMGKMLAGLRTLFQEISETKNLINTLGWEAPPGLDDIGLGTIDFSSFLSKLQAVLDSSKTELEDEVLMAQRIAELSIALKEFVETIFQLADTLPGKLSSLGDYADRTNIKGELPKRLFNFWATTYLSGYSPRIFSIFHLINVVEFKHFEPDPAIFQIDHVRPILHFDAFGSFLSDPAAHFKAVYGWGTPDFSDPDLLLRISLLLESLGIAVLLRPLDPRAEHLLNVADDAVNVSDDIFRKQDALDSIRLNSFLQNVDSYRAVHSKQSTHTIESKSKPQLNRRELGGNDN